MKNKNSFIRFLTLAIFAFVFISCSGAFRDITNEDAAKNDGKAYISLSVEVGSGRTVFADDVAKEDLSYVLKGTISGGKEQELGKWDTYEKLTKATAIEIDEGTWSFTLDASKSGVKLYTATIDTAEIKSGNNSLKFTLKSANESGKGVVAIDITFPSDAEVKTVKAGLQKVRYDATEEMQYISGFELKDLTTTSNSAKGNFADVPNGSYILQISFYKEDGSEIKPGYSEIVKVMAGRVTQVKKEILDLEKYHKVAYKFIFDGKDVTNEITDCTLSLISTLNEQEKVELPAIDSDVNYNFVLDGWYKEEKCTTQITEIPVGTTSDITVYAKISTIITFEFRNGTDSQFVKGKSGTAITETVTVPTKTGYKFDGWKIGDEIIKKIPEKFPVEKLSKTFVYNASFSPITYKIKFDKNDDGATGDAMAELSLKYGEEKALTANTFSKTGSVFAGWSTEKTGEAIYADEAPIKNLTTEDDKTITLYAIWDTGELADYTVTYYFESVDGRYKKDDDIALKGVVGKKTLAVGKTFPGFDCVGTDRTTDDDTIVQETIAASGTNVKVYYKRKVVNVIFKDGENIIRTVTGKYGADVVSPENPRKDGYLFKDWGIVPDTFPEENTICTAEWIKVMTIDYKFIYDGGEVGIEVISIKDGYEIPMVFNETENVVLPTKNEVTLNKYTIEGWYKEETLENALTAIPSGTKENVTVYAKLEPIPVEDIWLDNPISELAYKRSKWIGATVKPDNAYDKTVVWTSSDESIATVTDGTVTSVGAGTVTITAKAGDKTASCEIFIDAPVMVTLNFILDNGTMHYTVQGEPKADVATVKAPEKDGYKFDYWMDADGNKATIPAKFPEVENSKSITYKAKFTPNTYKVAFDKNNASATETMAELTLNYDEEKALTANAFELTGYVFTGWATSATGDAVYADGAMVKNLSATDGDTITLYAKWVAGEPVEYTVEHYQESIGGTYSTPVDVDTLKGVVETNTLATAKIYPGFVCVGTDTTTDDNTIEQVAIEATGTVVRIYYKRKTITLTFKDGDEVFNTMTGKFGDATSYPTKPKKPAYTFLGWDTEVPATYPAEDMTFNATWEASKVIIEINLPDNEDIEPLKVEVDGDEITFTADGKFSNYRWSVDDEVFSNSNSSEAVVTKEWALAVFGGGKHTIMVVIYDSAKDEYYSASGTFEFVEE